MTPAFSLDSITCTFVSRDAPGQRYTAVRGVTLAVAPGEFVSVVGPTGCGKSTLLNVAAGLLAPSAGSVHVFGEPLAGINARAGYMFQWHVLTKPDLIPPIFFDNDRQAAFFFGEPIKIFARIWDWFFGVRDIYGHLWVTLLETVLAFGIGTVAGLAVGMWLALSPLAAAILDPYIKALNSMPRVILAPIFAVWFGLGIASKVAMAAAVRRNGKTLTAIPSIGP
jgi:hypothetical protein